jgi:uncharacterized membrane protein YsdA (DUF1294 family)
LTRRSSRLGDPYRYFGSLSVGASIALALIFSLIANPIIAWLCAINIITVVAFRYDKSIAGSKHTRVPEAVLLLLEAIGGTLGASMAMWIIRPRHKTESGDFLLPFFIIMTFQFVALAVVCYFFAR